MFTLYSAEVTGNPGNCSYPHKHVIASGRTSQNEYFVKYALRHSA